MQAETIPILCVPRSVSLSRYIRMSLASRKSRWSTALLWLGVLAIVLHSLAGIAHPRVGTSSDGLIELCTAQGMIKIDTATGMVVSQQPGSSQDDNQPRCCDLCAACGAPAIANGHPLMVFSAAFATIDAQAPPTVEFFPAAHPALTPLVPRGPPALS